MKLSPKHKTCLSLLAVAGVLIAVSYSACGLDDANTGDEGGRNMSSHSTQGSKETASLETYCWHELTANIETLHYYRREQQTLTRMTFRKDPTSSNLLFIDTNDLPYKPKPQTADWIDISSTINHFEALSRQPDPDLPALRDCSDYTFPIAEYNLLSNKVGTIDDISIAGERLSIDSQFGRDCWAGQSLYDNGAIITRKFYRDRNDDTLKVALNEKIIVTPTWDMLQKYSELIRTEQWLSVKCDLLNAMKAEYTEKLTIQNAPGNHKSIEAQSANTEKIGAVQPTAIEKCVNNCEGVAERRGPGKNFLKVATLPPRTIIRIQSTDGKPTTFSSEGYDWFRVTSDTTGSTNWVASEFLADTCNLTCDEEQ